MRSKAQGDRSAIKPCSILFGHSREPFNTKYTLLIVIYAVQTFAMSSVRPMMVISTTDEDVQA